MAARLGERVVRLSESRILIAGILLLAVVWPLVTSEYFTFLATNLLILAIFGLAFNLVFGFANLPAFGHAAFYGLGAYGFALSLQAGQNIAVGIVVAILAATIFGAFVAYFSTRGLGIYFAVLTFAFAQFLFEVFFRLTEFTGGANGVFISMPRSMAVVLTQTNLYFVSLAILLVYLGISRRLIASPFGKVLQAIRYNQERARSIGYPVRLVKIVVFSISALLSSVAGVLHAVNVNIVTPNVLFYQVSIDAIVVTVIGGSSFILGPVVGAVVLTILSESTRNLANLGNALIGFIFIAIILFTSDGILGFVRRRLK